MAPPLQHASGSLNTAEIRALLEQVRDLATNYQENVKKREMGVSFNLFDLISDHYYRETFHSDILHGFLNPKSAHGEGDTYLKLFIEFLNTIPFVDGDEGSTCIDLTEYSNAKVDKEKGRLDLLITSESHKRAIIIENKINGARDQPEQVWRYLDYLAKKKIPCDAIVYLTLDQCSVPEMNWLSDKIEPVRSKLKLVCAYDGIDGGREEDLLRGWILKCQEHSAMGSDAQSILRQYAKVLIKLAGNAINRPIMQQFYESFVTDNASFQTIVTLRKMLDELVNWWPSRIVDTFKTDCSPFKRLLHHENGAIFTDASYNGTPVELAIWLVPQNGPISGDTQFYFEFSDKGSGATKNRQAELLLNKMSCRDEFTFEQERFRKRFDFPGDEAALVVYIKQFKQKLGDALGAL